MDKIYLFGSGTSVGTKALRRSSRFKASSFRIGDIPIRANRRYTVTLDWVRKHVDSVIAKIRTGQLVVQHSHDDFVDPTELLALLGQAPASVESVTPPLEEIVPPVVPVLVEPVATVVEPVVEPVTTVEVAPEPVVEPVVEAPVEPAPVELKKAGPDAESLSAMSKNALLALCEERGITASADDSKRILVAKLLA